MRRSVLVILLLTSVKGVFSQSETKVYSRWFFDASIGVNQSKISGSEVDFMQDIVTSHGDGELEIKNKTGIDLGFHAKWTASHFHIKSGLQYIERGASLENTRYVEKPMVHSGFLGIPLAFGLNTSNYKSDTKVGFYVEGGIAYLFNINDQSSGWISETPPIVDLTLEGGFEAAISEAVFVGLRYKYMKDLTEAYTFHRQYSDGTGNLNLFRDYQYFYTAHTFSASIRVKLAAK